MDVSENRKPDYESQFADVADMDDFYGRIEDMGVVCGWRKGGDKSRDAEPSSPYKSAHWKYAQCRAALDAAAKLISAEDAGRRILNFRNPIPENDLGSSRTLLNAY